jgi:hypothetical protein
LPWTKKKQGAGEHLHRSSQNESNMAIGNRLPMAIKES